MSNRKRKKMEDAAAKQRAAPGVGKQAVTPTVCRDFNAGKCKSHQNGPSGQFTCSQRDNCFHTCSTCGKPGHSAMDCWSGQHRQADKGKGKNGKGKDKKNKKNKKDR